MEECYFNKVVLCHISFSNLSEFIDKNYLGKYHAGIMLKLTVIDSLKESFAKAKYILTWILGFFHLEPFN